MSDTNIVISEKQHTERAALGFNIGLIASQQNPGMYHGLDLYRMYDGLPVEALRYPGGTFANFFNWKELTLNESAINRSFKKKLINNINWQKQLNNNRLVKAELKSFSQIITKKNLRPFIVLNLYSSSISEIHSAIYKVKSSFVDTPINWELGNELLYYDYLHNRDVHNNRWSENNYYIKAKEIALYIKKKYPDDKVGVLVSELISERNLFPNSVKRYEDRLNRWDTKLSTDSWFDAIIYHPYLFSHSDDLWKKFLTNNTSNYSSQESLRDIKRNWIAEQIKEVPKGYVERANKYFPDKKIWITESGLLGQELNKSTYPDYPSTHTLFRLAYLISWLHESTNLKAFLFHNLSHSDRLSSTTPAYFNDLSLNYNSLAYYLIAWFFNEQDAYTTLLGELPNEKGAAYILKNDEKIIYVNMSGKPITINNEEQYSVGSIIPHGIIDGIRKGDVRKISSIICSNDFTSSNNTLPPYAIGVASKADDFCFHE